MMRILIALILGFTFCASQNSNLPGINAGIGRGFDIVYYSPRAPVLKWNYNQGNTWSNTLTKQDYTTPDEIWVTNTPSISYFDSSYTFGNFTDYVNQQYHWNSLTFSIPGIFSFGMSDQAGIVKSMMGNGNVTLYMINREFHIYRMSTWPAAVLPSGSVGFFAQQLAKLPLDYNSNKAAYKTFIRTFGTHFVPEADYGGMFTYYVAVNNSLIQKYSQSWVSNQISISLSWKDLSFGYQAGSNKTNEKVSNEFLSNSQTNMSWVGGTPEGFEQDFPTWYTTVLQNPAMIQPHLQSFASFTTNPTLQASLNAAVKDYTNTQPLPLFSMKKGMLEPYTTTCMGGLTCTHINRI